MLKNQSVYFSINLFYPDVRFFIGTEIFGEVEKETVILEGMSNYCLDFEYFGPHEEPNPGRNVSVE